MTRTLQSSLRGEDRDGYVFISYKREDVEHAKQMRTALLGLQFEVWWDEDIQCGQVWNEVLDEAVKQAGVIVVLWSTKSMGSRWVTHEASSAMDRGVYAPVRIELMKIESPYDRQQATDLLDWCGEMDHPGFLDLLGHLNRLLPPRKSLPTQARDWLWGNRVSIAAVLFGCVALMILGWQVFATSFQLKRLDSLTREQEAITADIKTFRQEQNDTTRDIRLSTLSLNSLDLEWKFSKVPPWADDLIDRAEEATLNTMDSIENSSSDDPRQYKAIENSLHIEYALNPAIEALARGKENIDDLFSPNFRNSSRPQLEVLLPLASDFSAALSLGKRKDDPNEPAYKLLIESLEEKQRCFYKAIKEKTRHRFVAHVGIQESAFVMNWEYPLGSLRNAIARTDPSQSLSGLLPRKFSLIVIHSSMEKRHYLQRAGKLFADHTQSASAGIPDWSHTSTLRVTINKSPSSVYEYAVTNCGTSKEKTYVFDDQPDYEFEYTRFLCER